MAEAFNPSGIALLNMITAGGLKFISAEYKSAEYFYSSDEGAEYTTFSASIPSDACIAIIQTVVGSSSSYYGAVCLAPLDTYTYFGLGNLGKYGVINLKTGKCMSNMSDGRIYFEINIFYFG